MSAIHANENLSLKMPLVWSVALHAAITLTALVSNFNGFRGDLWGGGGAGGAAVSVGLVGSLPGVPLPRPEAITPSRVVDETRGLYKAEPKPRPEDGKLLPEFEKNKPPKYISRPSKVLEDNAPPPDNAVPYGAGGTPSLPYTQFSMGSGTSAGLNLGGPGGDFGGKFPWYVEAVRRRVSGNWLQSTIDPGLRFAPRCVIHFQILRDGSVGTIEMQRSSGNDSVDRSAIRAIRDSSPFERLPGGYSGSYVMVEFWFEFKR